MSEQLPTGPHFTGEKLFGQAAIDNARATGRNVVLLQVNPRSTITLTLDLAEHHVKNDPELVWCWEVMP